MSRSACRGLLEFGCELQPVFDEMVQPCTDLTKLRLRKFAQLGLHLFDFAHAQRLNGFFSTSGAPHNTARRSQAFRLKPHNFWLKDELLEDNADCNVTSLHS